MRTAFLVPHPIESRTSTHAAHASPAAAREIVRALALALGVDER